MTAPAEKTESLPRVGARQQRRSLMVAWHLEPCTLYLAPLCFSTPLSASPARSERAPAPRPGDGDSGQGNAQAEGVDLPHVPQQGRQDSPSQDEGRGGCPCGSQAAHVRLDNAGQGGKSAGKKTHDQCGLQKHNYLEPGSRQDAQKHGGDPRGKQKQGDGPLLPDPVRDPPPRKVITSPVIWEIPRRVFADSPSMPRSLTRYRGAWSKRPPARPYPGQTGSP